ncbi:MAG: hypothetical protein K0U29_00300 [Gammaproteobacteria bacterium]|nr:hypothetical protein [Gammaproteobacteria bacterium]MCH9743347.1 hypothetical protein [Gammaproteobacteria bacterium]
MPAKSEIASIHYDLITPMIYVYGESVSDAAIVLCQSVAEGSEVCWVAFAVNENELNAALNHLKVFFERVEDSENFVVSVCQLKDASSLDYCRENLNEVYPFVKRSIAGCERKPDEYGHNSVTTHLPSYKREKKNHRFPDPFQLGDNPYVRVYLTESGLTKMRHDAALKRPLKSGDEAVDTLARELEFNATGKNATPLTQRKSNVEALFYRIIEDESQSIQLRAELAEAIEADLKASLNPTLHSKLNQITLRRWGLYRGQHKSTTTYQHMMAAITACKRERFNVESIKEITDSEGLATKVIEILQGYFNLPEGSYSLKEKKDRALSCLKTIVAQHPTLSEDSTALHTIYLALQAAETDSQAELAGVTRHRGFFRPAAHGKTDTYEAMIRLLRTKIVYNEARKAAESAKASGREPYSIPDGFEASGVFRDISSYPGHIASALVSYMTLGDEEAPTADGLLATVAHTVAGLPDNIRRAARR